MPRTAITVQTPKGPYPGTVAPNALDVTWTAADAANDNDFNFTGKELILVRNVHATLAKTFTLTSAPDPQLRSADIATYSLGALEFAAYLASSVIGWAQSGQKFHLDGEDNNIEFMILRIG